MRRLLASTCHGLAWCALVTALPGIWVAGFLRGVALGLVSVRHSNGSPFIRQAVLTEAEAMQMVAQHERAIQRGRESVH